MVVGNPVQFTWSYSGRDGGVGFVICGLKKDPTKEVDPNGVLLHINCQTGKELPINIPQRYSGRINLNFSGDQSSGQISFTLYPVENDDEKHYGCMLIPVDNFKPRVFDYANLVVQGELSYSVEFIGTLLTFYNFPFDYGTFLGKKVTHTFSKAIQQELWVTSLLSQI